MLNLGGLVKGRENMFWRLKFNYLKVAENLSYILKVENILK